MNERRDPIDAIVGEYLDRMLAGESLDPVEIAARHPDLGEEILEELRGFVDLSADDPIEKSPAVLGDYTLRRQIGRGGMGVVYEAWENSMDRPVALKILPGAIAADDRAVSRFVREARVAGKLGHPNVVSVHGMGVKEDIPYYAMEYVEGETLAQIIARTKDAAPGAETPFGEKDELSYFSRLAKVFADVADGLQHAHTKGQ